MRIRIEPNWHQAIVGTTGSGKTTLEKILAQSYAATLNLRKAPMYYQIFILDTKHDGDFDMLGTKYHHIQQIFQDRRSRIVIYEPWDEEDRPEFYELFLRMVWDRWMMVPGKSQKSRVPAVVLIDELTTLEIKSGNKSILDPKRTHAWSEIMKRGRSAHVVLWNVTQNPVYVPEDFFRNASAFFMFRLNRIDDRKRMAEFMGTEVLQEIPTNYPHGFWYYHTGGGNMIHPAFIPQLNVVGIR